MQCAIRNEVFSVHVSESARDQKQKVVPGTILGTQAEQAHRSETVDSIGLRRPRRAKQRQTWFSHNHKGILASGGVWQEATLCLEVEV